MNIKKYLSNSKISPIQYLQINEQANKIVLTDNIEFHISRMK